MARQNVNCKGSVRDKLKSVLCSLILLALPFLFGFTDLDEGHWAYGAVTQLVNEGAVSGFEDGSFRPNEPVTRAQFVKMTGYRTEAEKSERPFDLKHRHWSYDYVMHSPLREVNGNALPDEQMTREQAAVYLYDCFGNNAKSDAPTFVLGNTSDKTEIGWAYEHGIMVGSDGINLRLSDTLTRAEAATLIVNSRGKLNSTQDFADTLPDGALESFFNGCRLFDVPYDESALITNGEIARAAYRIRIDELGGLWYSEKADFEHKYANDLKAMEPILGEDKISASFADAPATVGDALAMLSYGAAGKIHTPKAYGVKEPTYPDARQDGEAAKALSFAYRNGIRPFAGGTLGNSENATHETVASILVQLDLVFGIETSVGTDGTKLTYSDETAKFTDLPTNAADFSVILKNVPNAVFEAPYIFADGVESVKLKPRENYAFHSSMKNAYSVRLAQIAQDMSERCGAKVSLTFYPQLVYDNGAGFTVRAKVEVSDFGSAGSDEALAAGLTIVHKEGNGVFWVDVPLSYTFFLE